MVIKPVSSNRPQPNNPLVSPTHGDYVSYGPIRIYIGDFGDIAGPTVMHLMYLRRPNGQSGSWEYCDPGQVLGSGKTHTDQIKQTVLAIDGHYQYLTLNLSQEDGDGATHFYEGKNELFSQGEKYQYKIKVEGGFRGYLAALREASAYFARQLTIANT